MENENFIKDFVEFFENTEVPDRFALWSAIGAISCALGRRVSFDMGHYSVYPNQYIVLVGGSGIRKSTPIVYAAKLLSQLDPPPNILPEKITAEKLIEMIRQDSPGEGKINLREESVGFVIPDELATFLNRKMYEAGLGSILTPLWDCKEFTYATLSRGKEIVKNPCFGILAGATIDWLQAAVPPEAVGGGVTSRFIFVLVEDESKPVLWTPVTPEKKILEERMLRGLRRISTYSGEIKLTEDVKTTFEKDYVQFKTTTLMKNDKNLSGYANRRHIHLLKVATAFCVSESSDLVIKLKHYAGAKAMLEDVELSMPIVMSLITSTVHGASLARVMSAIRRAGDKGVLRTTLLRMFLHQLTSRELSEILETLDHSRKISKRVAGVDTVYYAT